MEFWQGGEHRLHDRLEYSLADREWKKQRLNP
jgi:pyridoxamine 5'-phosphate oxidase